MGGRKGFTQLLLSLMLPGIIVSTLALSKNIQLVLDEARKRQRPNAGETQTLLRDAVHVIDLLRKHHIKDYQITDLYRTDAELHQRTVEGAWPIRPSDSSKYKLAKLSENVPCQLIDQTPSVALYVC